jgi:hypothetical protein
MFSIHRIAMLAMVTGMLAGCSVSLEPKNPGPLTLSNAPITTDAAMQTRQWDATDANYANDTVWAHPFYSPLVPDTYSYKANAVTENVIFLGNVIYIPVGLFVQFPWTYQANESLALPGTYTLMPPLPEGAEPVPTY